MAEEQKDQNNMNVIDSAVVKVGWIVDTDGLLSDVQNAIKLAQQEIDKSGLKLNIGNASIPSSSSNVGDGKKLMNVHGLGGISLSTARLSDVQLKEVISLASTAEKEARAMTTERMRMQQEFKLQMKQLEMQQRKQQFSARSISQIPSMLGGSAEGNISQLGVMFGASSMAAMATITTLGVISAMVVKEVLKNSNEISNKFISANSSFVDQTTKNTMAMFGVSGVEASGINKSLSLLGMTSNDFMLMTPAQQASFSNLMESWVSSVNGLDQTKLKDYTEATQSYQLMIAESKLDLEIAKMKILLNNKDSIAGVQESIGKLYKNFVELAENPIVQEGIGAILFLANALIELLNSIISITNYIGGIFGGGSSVTNTSVNTTTNNYSISSGMDIEGAYLR